MPLAKYQRGRIWWVRGTVRGNYTNESAGTAVEEQAETYRATREAELYEESIFGPRAVVSFRRCARAYLAFEPRSPRTIARVNRLIAHFGDTRLAKIDQAAADAAVKKICRKGVKGSTRIAQVYGPLGTVFRFGASPARGWCEFRIFDKPTVERTATVWLTPEQALKLEAAAAPHLKALIRFLVCTGARLSEALDLDWEDVDLPASLAVFRGTKQENATETVRPRAASLPPAAIAVLAGLEGDRTGKVFRRDDGLPYEDRERQEGGQIRSAWRTACRKAGLPGQWKIAVRKRVVRWRIRGGGYKTRTTINPQRVWVPDMTPHDLRHSWATWFYALSKDMMLLRDEGGWSTTKMVERYAHLMRSDQLAGILKVWGPSHPRIGGLRTRLVQSAPAVGKKTGRTA